MFTGVLHLDDTPHVPLVGQNLEQQLMCLCVVALDYFALFTVELV